MLIREMENGDVGYISENAIVVSLPKIEYNVTGMFKVEYNFTGMFKVEYNVTGIFTVVKDNSGFRKMKIAKVMDIYWVDYELLDSTSIIVVNEIDNINRYPAVLLPANALDAIIATVNVTRKHKVILRDDTSVVVQANHFDSHDGILYFWNDGVEKYSRVNIAKFARDEWKCVTEA